MIITVVLNGYSSSVDPTKTSMVVAGVLACLGAPHRTLALKARFAYGQTREVRKFIVSNDDQHHDLLLVGKSLGARNLVERVINRWVSYPSYRSVHLVTIDPNWPEPFNLRPNLNRSTLKMTRALDSATNIFVVGRPDQQAGAMLVGPHGAPIINIPIVGSDHHAISSHPTVRKELSQLVKSIMRCDGSDPIDLV